MSVTWKIKAGVQGALSLAPNPATMNLWFQRHVTRALPPDDTRILDRIKWARHHVGQYERFGVRTLADSRFFEFGAGWDFAQALAQRALGVPHQLVVDIRRLGRVDIAEAAVESLHRLMPEFAAMEAEPQTDGSLSALLERFGVEYLAPADARSTELPDACIDCVTSTDTFEHIPPSDITAILRECRRILTCDGIMTFRIDYRDHWAYFDHRITPVNMLRYTDQEWKRYNSSLNYQNRLRHSDYLKIFDTMGLEVVAEEQETAVPASRDFLLRHPIAPKFCGYTTEQLLVPSATITLRKRASQSGADAPRLAVDTIM